mmetsp:Transcript_151396/g.263908  ORF Transcript_151396/g.263908 Transcript_151396/m.263908 type:complete len:432 (-) Transcript_151396:38-1333(-)
MGCQGSKGGAGTPDPSVRSDVSSVPLNRASSKTLLADPRSVAAAGIDASPPKIVSAHDQRETPRESIDLPAEDIRVVKPPPPPGLQELIYVLRSAGTINKDEVEQAMLATDRRHYAPRSPYVDAPQQIGYGATISAPHMHAHALELLSESLRPGARVLDVGCGSGYLSACMARMVGQTGKVVAIDHVQQLVELCNSNLRKADGALLDDGRLLVKKGDGWKGVPEHGPYDCIHVGAAAETVPIPLLEQLKPGGRMVIPVGTRSQHFYQIDRRQDGSYTETQLMGVRYVPLVNPDWTAGIPPLAFEQAEPTKVAERLQSASTGAACVPTTPKAPQATVESLEPMQMTWVPPGGTQFAPRADGKAANDALFPAARLLEEAKQKHEEAPEKIPEYDANVPLFQVKDGKTVEPSDSNCCCCCPKQGRRQKREGGCC